MLVLSRKAGQEVVIAGKIRVRVLEVRGSRVRLGFTAPDEVEIQRGELVTAGVSMPVEESPTPVGAAGSWSRSNAMA